MKKTCIHSYYLCKRKRMLNLNSDAYEGIGIMGVGSCDMRFVSGLLVLYNSCSLRYCSFTDMAI